MQLSGKRVWLTGASSGIGEALAYALAREGAQLVLSARREAELQAVRSRCAHPERHSVATLDLSNADAVPARAAAILAQHGPVDILINNAGIGQRATALDTTLEVDRRIMEVNHFATVALTRAVLPVMLARGDGLISSVASVVGKLGTPRRSAYAASKHALAGFMESLRAELRGSGVRVQVIFPGYIRTPFPVHALKGDGAAQGHMDRAQIEGMAPETCAQHIVRALRREPAEVLVGGRETWAVYIKQLCPPLFRYIISRVRVT